MGPKANAKRYEANLWEELKGYKDKMSDAFTSIPSFFSDVVKPSLRMNKSYPTKKSQFRKLLNFNQLVAMEEEMKKGDYNGLKDSYQRMAREVYPRIDPHGAMLIQKISEEGRADERTIGHLVALSEKKLEVEDRIFKRHKAIAYSVANKYSCIWNEFDDMVAYGNQGLLIAITNFDPGLGKPFYPYAKEVVKNALLNGMIRESRLFTCRPFKNSSEFKRLNARFEKEYGRKPSMREVAEGLDISMKEAGCLAISIMKPGSLDAGPENSKYTFLDLFADENTADAEEQIVESELGKVLREAIDTLTPKEKAIIEERYYGDCTLQDIGDKYNVSRQRIRQIEDKALKKLKKSRYRKSLEDYL